MTISHLSAMTVISLRSPLRAIRRWWLMHVEYHYCICAEVEKQAARAAQQNARHFEARATLARSARQDLQ